MLKTSFKKQFIQFADKHFSTDTTPGQQSAACSQWSRRRRESWGNRGEEKSLHMFWSFRSYFTAHPC